MRRRAWQGACSPFGVGVALQLATAALCASQPLWGQMGYPYALAATLVAALTAPSFGLQGARRSPQAPQRALGRVLAGSLAIWLPGTALMVAHELWGQPCNLGQALVMALVLPLMTQATGGVMGWLVGQSTHRCRPAGAYAWLALVQATSFGLMLARLYFEPPIQLFDPLWGYFSGSLYDEAITLPRAFWAMRATTLALWAMVWCVANALERPDFLGRARALSAVGLTAALSYKVEPHFGTRVDHRQLQAALPRVIERPHLVLHLPADVPLHDAQRLADDHAERLQHLRAELGVAPAWPLHSYVYRDPKHKAVWMGGAHTMVAKPWLHEIHVHGVASPHPLVAHEMVHALAAAWARPPLYVSASYGVGVHMGLVEGLAVALAPDWPGAPVQAQAQALYAMRLAVPLETLLGGPAAFWRQPPARAYAQAGALLRFVRARHGMVALQALYQGTPLEAVTGEPVAVTEAALRAHLGAAPEAEPNTQALARTRMAETSIFERVCAQEIARLRERAWAAPAHEAPDRWQAVLGCPGHHLGDRYQLARALGAAGERAKARAALDAAGAAAADSPPWQARVLLTQLQREVAWGPHEAATGLDIPAHLARLEALRPTGPLLREFLLTTWALQQQPEVAQGVLRYLLGEAGPVEAAVLLAGRTEAPLARYLLGRLLHAQGLWGQTLHTLTATGPLAHDVLEAERGRLAAEAAWRLGDTQQALMWGQKLCDDPRYGAHQAFGCDLFERLTR